MSGQPVKLPLPPGKILVFDHIAGKVYVADQTPGPWTPPRYGAPGSGATAP